MIPPWTIELLRRGLSDVARKVGEPDALEKLKRQASDLLSDLPDTAARSIDAIIRKAESGKRTVQRWARKHTALAVPMINASGVLLTESGSGVPLGAKAIEVGREYLAGDVVRGPLAQQLLSHRLQRLSPIAGDHAIAVATSLPAALTAFSLLGADRQLVVHRSQAVRLPNGQALPDAFATVLPVIQEVGSVSGIHPVDFAGLERFCLVMADGGRHPVELVELPARDAMQAVVLPVATLATTGDDQMPAAQQIPSAQSMLEAGADFVILPGDGVCGGPPCGILIGREPEIERITQSAAWPSLVADEAITASLIATLDRDSEQDVTTPMQALLETSEENLRSRAERLATRLTAEEDIQSCQVTAEDARITPEGRWRFPSRQLRLRHASKSATSWCESLRDDLPAVFADHDDELLKIDLRWVPASADNRLAQVLIGKNEQEDG